MNPEVKAKAVASQAGTVAVSRFSCPNCKSKVVRRIRRKGFWQRNVLSLMGYYPWVCRECRHHFMLRSRKDDTFGYIDDER